MAFQNKRISVLAYANGFTLWHYNADEPLSDVEKADYFAPIYTLCAEGDIIIISATDSTAIRTIESVNANRVRIKPLDK